MLYLTLSYLLICICNSANSTVQYNIYLCLFFRCNSSNTFKLFPSLNLEIPILPCSENIELVRLGTVVSPEKSNIFALDNDTEQILVILHCETKISRKIALSF